MKYWVILLVFVLLGCGSSKTETHVKHDSQEQLQTLKEQDVKSGHDEKRSTELFKRFLEEISLSVTPEKGQVYEVNYGDFRYKGDAPLSLRNRKTDTVYEKVIERIHDTVVKNGVFKIDFSGIVFEENKKITKRKTKSFWWAWLLSGTILGAVTSKRFL